jgi:hypothetical protein
MTSGSLFLTTICQTLAFHSLEALDAMDLRNIAISLIELAASPRICTW